MDSEDRISRLSGIAAHRRAAQRPIDEAAFSRAMDVMVSIGREMTEAEIIAFREQFRRPEKPDHEERTYLQAFRLDTGRRP